MNFLEYQGIENDPVKTGEIELVERKGVGHPDTISDGIAEAVSRRLAKYYRNEFGHILHHNTDEVQLVAGESRPEFGGGSLEKPIYILLAGRATNRFKGEKIPIHELAVEAAQNYVEENFRYLSSEHIDFDSRIGRTSTDLENVFKRSGAPYSNDTSFGVGHAPLSPVEKTVRNIEQKLLELEEIGEDIKVMGLRRGRELTLTVAAPAVSRKVSNLEEYRHLVQQIESITQSFASQTTGLDVNVHVNTADNIEEKSVYLTETGTSAEMGDDGSVGRGNRINGLITPNRSMSLEAAAGKNPVTHVGKIYNVLSREIAQDINQNSGEYAQVKVLAQIGRPIDDPQVVHVESSASEKTVEEAVKSNLEDLDSITDKIIGEEIKIV